MAAVSLFPFAEYWWFYGTFTLFVLGMLALDLSASFTARRTKFRHARRSRGV